MLRGIRIALLGAAIAALFVVGCGGGDDDSEPLSKTAFVKEANEICTNAEKQKTKLLEDWLAKLSKEKKTPTPEEQEKFVPTLLPPIEEMTEELAELEPPSKDAEEIEKLISGFESSIEKLEDDPASATTPTADPFGEPNKIANNYGLSACGSL